MSDSVHKDWTELGRPVSDSQTRIFLRLVFDIWEALEKYDQRFVTVDPSPLARQSQTRPPDLAVRGNSMTRKNRTSQLLMLAFALALVSKAQVGMAQSIMGHSINEQKKAVVFIFGTIHPLNPDKSAMMDASGNRAAVNVPLGTGFFVAYADRRRRPNHDFSYLVTAKHVLLDVDGTFLPSVTIRLNLQSAAADSDFGFIRDIPVTDAQGNLLWLHSEDQAEDVVVLPLSPDQHEFDFTTISTGMFLNDRALNSGAVAEGDDLYFIGLMEQYYGTKRNYPLVRRGTLALLTDEYIDTPSGRQKIFIADLQSWPGNSGSPVFILGGRRDRPIVAGSNFGFLGMIVASFLNRFTVPLNGEQPARQLETGDRANTGVTCIVPAAVIEKVLDSAPAQEDRDTRIRSLNGVVH
jgi:hypothetical protein